MITTSRCASALLVMLCVVVGGCQAPDDAATPDGATSDRGVDAPASRDDLGVMIPLCVPGASQTCACIDGRTGAQTCGFAGTYEACRCVAAMADGGTLGDASTALDAVTPTDLGVDIGSGGGDLGPPVPRCVPGVSQACSCFDARAGAQVCRADGTFDPCLCLGATSEDGGTAVAPDARPISELPVEVVVGELHSCARRADGAVYCWGRGQFTATGSAPEAAHLTPLRTMGIEDAIAFAGPTCVLRRDHTALCWSCSGCMGIRYTTNPLPRPVLGITNITSTSADFSNGACYFRDSGPPLCVGDVIFPGVNPFPRGFEPYPGFLLLPTPFEGVGGVVQVAGFRGTTCARLSAGQVLCWGAAGDMPGSGYQLGDGLTRHPSDCGMPPSGAPWNPVYDCSLVPVRVIGLDDAVELVSGGGPLSTSYAGLSGGRFCVRRASGSVSCWGSNVGGQLGDGTTADRAAPVTVLGVHDAIRLAANGAVSCALLRGGTVTCWGANGFGQLGDGRADHGMPPSSELTGDYSPTPVPVVGLTRIVQISVSGGHACALRDDGRIFCWGSNFYGELGNNTATESNVPVEVRWP